MQNRRHDISFGPRNRTQTDGAFSLLISPLLHVKVSSKAAIAEKLPDAQAPPPPLLSEGQWLSYLQALPEAELKSAFFNLSSLVSLYILTELNKLILPVIGQYPKYLKTMM